MKGVVHLGVVNILRSHLFSPKKLTSFMNETLLSYAIKGEGRSKILYQNKLRKFCLIQNFGRL